DQQAHVRQQTLQRNGRGLLVAVPRSHLHRDVGAGDVLLRLLEPVKSARGPVVHRPVAERRLHEVVGLRAQQDIAVRVNSPRLDRDAQLREALAGAGLAAWVDLQRVLSDAEVDAAVLVKVGVVAIEPRALLRAAEVLHLAFGAEEDGAGGVLGRAGGEGVADQLALLFAGHGVEGQTHRGLSFSLARMRANGSPVAISSKCHWLCAMRSSAASRLSTHFSQIQCGAKCCTGMPSTRARTPIALLQITTLRAPARAWASLSSLPLSPGCAISLTGNGACRRRFASMRLPQLGGLAISVEPMPR